ncbi:hypothetical protein B0H17DRAFT_1194406 [Mycena rosella]|uniref:Uncharacterized protein n=1 Tax=Mycena rosella TaxID=1033263 RepID=A0AAD7GNF8_MYCRO|nr:hypothetical protein B0H17DRAFT_1194406 [Mycena rosella]
MRKTSYALTAFAVCCTLVFTILALTRNDWIVAKYQSDALNSSYEAFYGLHTVCERLVIQMPGGGPPLVDKLKCRRFPDARDKDIDQCKDENRFFCAAWTSAGYAVELAIGFGALSLATIAIGVSTRSRRRRIWRAVAGIVILQSVFQLVAFALVVDMLRTSRFPTFVEDAKLGPALVFDAVAWVVGILTAISVISTGIAADKGHRWAAGHRAYEPIDG